jgi:c-di-GMP-binding flagellar brake protein YcgR
MDLSKPSFEGMNLQVGARLQLMLKHGSKQVVYYSSLIGFIVGEYLLIKIPIERGLSVPIKEGEQLAIRVFSGVSVFTFTCDVESIHLSPHFYMHVSFPKAIQAIALRNAVRVKVDLPVRVKLASDPESDLNGAMLSDLSVTGASLLVDRQLGEPGETIQVAFSFRIQPTNQEVKIATSATIRSTRQRNVDKVNDSMRFSYGIHFGQVEHNEQVMLQSYLHELLLENHQQLV